MRSLPRPARAAAGLAGAARPAAAQAHGVLAGAATGRASIPRAARVHQPAAPGRTVLPRPHGPVTRLAASARALGTACALVTVPPAARTHAQSPAPAAPQGPQGPHVTAGLVATRPTPGGAAGRAWDAVGDFGGAVGLSVGVGYDAGRVGAALELDGSNPAVGGRRANALALAAVVRWSPGAVLPRGWRPRLAAGYVRYGLGGAPVYAREVPPGLFRAGEPGAASDPTLTLLGNGARLALSADRAIGRRLGARVEAGADVVHFGTATYDGYDWSLRDPGWGVAPRLTAGVRWSPF